MNKQLVILQQNIKKEGIKMLDKKYNALEKEQKWLNYWKDNNIYEFK